MKLWMLDKARKLKVEYEHSSHNGRGFFLVDDEYHVMISDDFEMTCDCLYGMGRGEHEGMCPHQLACILFLSRHYSDLEEEVKDNIDTIQNHSIGKELTRTEKKKLRNVLSCEVCGEDNVQIHRIHRQGDYSLRNIIPLCKKHHKELHKNERGIRSK